MQALIILVTAVLLGGVAAESAGTECSLQDARAGQCAVSADTTETDVTLTVDADSPGAEDLLRGHGENGDGGEDGDGGGSNSDGSSSQPCLNPDGSACRSPIIATITSPVTLRDIASFRPTASVSHSQPNGWTIAGLDTNFYATGAQHVVDGVLLGQPASVRFTPVAWNWTYGDGHTATRDVPGAPWPSRADEFNPTPTSHIYRERATFTITLAVDYAAEYRYAGGPWVPIAGTLRVPANDLTLTVGSAKTVLVNENCNQNPRGPGC